MATTTTYGLNKPTVGGDENTWGGLTNDNWDDVDDLLDGTTAITPNLGAGWEVDGVAVTATAAELNILDGVTASTAELNILDGVTASTAELNILDGVTASTAELNSILQLSGRNLIINGSGRINQRGYVSGTATTASNQFTLDRWFVLTLGQNLTFTGNESRRIMTAPVAGVRQVIEGANVVGGNYVLNWDGTATATVDGVARTKGEVFTLTANTNVIVAFAGGTFTDVQLERGTVATPFELRPIGQELTLCQRYYCITEATVRFPATGAQTVDTQIYWPVTMRGAPTTTRAGTSTNMISVTVAAPSIYGARFSATSIGAGDAFALNNPITATAELTS